MNIKQLKEYIKDLPDDMYVGITYRISDGITDFYKYLRLYDITGAKMFRIDGTIEEVEPDFPKLP